MRPCIVLFFSKPFLIRVTEIFLQAPQAPSILVDPWSLHLQHFLAVLPVNSYTVRGKDPNKPNRHKNTSLKACMGWHFQVVCFMKHDTCNLYGNLNFFLPLKIKLELWFAGAVMPISPPRHPGRIHLKIHQGVSIGMQRRKTHYKQTKTHCANTISN